MASMKNTTAGLALGALFTLGAAMGSATAADLSGVPSGNYKADPTHAYINFQYNHLGLSNPTLSFDDFTVDMNLDNEDPTKTTVAVSIDTDSILTGSAIWKDHLTGDKWFNTSEYPTITFESTGIEANADGSYVLVGNVTVKDVTKPITLDVSINAAKNHPMSGDPVIGLEATGNLLRSDFGLGKNAPHVSDEVALNITVEMSKSE